jgi:glycosyltransferase involved in cell wall biosynthesis
VYRDKSVAVVVPAHNEEQHIGEVLNGMPTFVDLIVVVDDGSSDNTESIVQRATRPGVVLLRHEENRGVGSAIVTGYRLVGERAIDIVAVMGGDGQMHPENLAPLIDPIADGRCGFSKGNRFYAWGSWKGMPRHRVFGNVVLSLLTKVASGYWHVFDAQNGFTAIAGEILRVLRLESLEVGYEFENRQLLELSLAGVSVSDIPFPARYGEEASGIRLWRDGRRILATLVSGFYSRIRSTYFRGGLSPQGGLLLAGSTLAAAGLAFGIWAWLTPWGRWSFVLAGIGVSIGVLLLCGFLLSDSRANRRLRPDDQRKFEALAPDASDLVQS